jgi:iron complex transport system substrate-binding protein
VRVVSLVPGATEALFACGAGGRVVGVSHECDHPPEARGLPRLTASALGDDAGTGAPPAAIDRAVSERFAAGGGLYTVDRERLAALRPDLVVAQALCPVCAVTADEVTAGSAPFAVRGVFEVFSWEASTLGTVLADVRRLGAAAGVALGADRLAAGLERRLDRLRETAPRRSGRRPRVVALEWLDPPWLGGHWVPEMIALAGGEDPLAEPGAPSRRAGWEEIAAADPDVLIAMPCGFGEAAAREQVAALAGREEWESLAAVRSGRVHAVDGGGLFSRPGPRLVDGAERLAEILATDSPPLRPG